MAGKKASKEKVKLADMKALPDDIEAVKKAFAISEYKILDLLKGVGPAVLAEYKESIAKTLIRSRHITASLRLSGEYHALQDNSEQYCEPKLQ